MTTPGQEASKGKVAAFVLFGVAAVAAVMGIVSVSGGGEAQNAAQASAGQHPGTPPPGGSSGSQPAPSPTSRSQVPPQPPPSSPGAGGETTKVVPAPAPGQQPPPQQAGQQVGDKSAPVRVYNNGTIKHLANQAADRLRGDGFNVVQVSNYPYGVIPTTTVYYQGSADQPTAESLAKDIGASTQPRFPGIASASPGVIVIVTNDYKN